MEELALSDPAPADLCHGKLIQANKKTRPEALDPPYHARLHLFTSA